MRVGEGMGRGGVMERREVPACFVSTGVSEKREKSESARAGRLGCGEERST